MVRSPVSFRPLFGAVLGMAAFCLAAPVAAQVVQVPAAHDNTLFEDLAGSRANGTGLLFAAGLSGYEIQRGLVSFDVAGAIPRGSTILSAALTLSCVYALDDAPRSVELHRVLSAWGEGSSAAGSGSPIGGAGAMPGDATWVHTFFPAQVWRNRGGDFDVSISTATDVGTIGDYSWTSTGMRDDVQRWLDDPASNFGWLLRGDEDKPFSAKDFFTRERASLDQPLLTVRYTAPLQASCVPDPSTLCLDDEPGDRRFAVRIHFATDRNGGLDGDAQAVPLGDRGIGRGGLFWFFSADNPEALVKVLDGCANNQHFWVYFSAGTDVGLTLDVLDEQTGQHYQRTFPDGVAVPTVQEVNALPCG